MKSNKKILFVITLVASLLIPCTAYCAEYGDEFPIYITYSGGSYIEVQSSLGRGSVIVQDTYKSGYFGFSGNGYNVCNLSNSTISGRFVLQNGKTYQCRLISFSTAQYYYESGVTREWRDLNISQIYNTNVEFIDYTQNNRNNQIDLFNNDSFSYFVVAILCCMFLLMLLNSIRGSN